MAQFTNTGLVAHAKTALQENWGYCLGAFGNLLTESFFRQKCSQSIGVGTYNASHADYLRGFMGHRVSDCYGLVKSYLWWKGGNPCYNASQDRNQEGVYNAATEKGPLSSMPETEGLILWMKGHAGIYAGNGEFIECAGAPTGIRLGAIRDGRVINGSRFTHWFKDTYIVYENAFEQACDKLEKNGVMNQASYWKQRKGIDPYFERLICNAAEKLP